MSWHMRVAVSLLALVFAAAPSGAETTDCTVIRSLPETITRSGVYCLVRNLSTSMTSGTAITVAADDVVIDLNGHVLDGSGAGLGTQANGILSDDGLSVTAPSRRNITVRNGTVRGFWAGVVLGGCGPVPTCDPASASQGHVIEDILADRNTKIGLGAWGHGTIVR